MSCSHVMFLPVDLKEPGRTCRQYGYNPALNPVEFHAALAHEPVELIKDGKLNFAIAFDREVEAQEGLHDFRKSVRNGVRALQEAVKKCTGMEAPVIDANCPEETGRYRYLILVGRSALTDELGLDTSRMPPEGFEVRTFGGGVAIAGDDGSLRPGGYDELDWARIRQNGTAHGVHDFIERFFGARFYFPGPGVIWPEITELTLLPVRYTDAPAFRNRHSHVFESLRFQDFSDTRALEDGGEAKWPRSWDGYAEDWRDFVWRWRIARGSQFDVTHSPRPHEWLAEHPDKKEKIFYRDPSGKLYYEPRQHIGNYYDVSDLELAGLYVRDVRRYYETGHDDLFRGWHQPNSLYIPFGQTDTFVSTMDTPVIRELGLIPESRRGNRDGELSDVYARFHIELAEMIKRELPDKRLAIMPYHNYALPPVLPHYREFPDNVDLRVCIFDFPRYAMNPEKVAPWKEQLKDWYEVLGGRPVVSLWLYNVPNFTWGRAVAGRYTGEIPQRLGRYLGREGMFFDFWGGLDWQHYPAYYTAFRSMWNPDFNVQAALDEHWELLYGDAAPYLKEFDDIVVERWEKVFAVKGTASAVYEEAYPMELLDKLEGLLEKAESALDEDSVEMTRFELFAAPWPAAIERMRGSIVFEKPAHTASRLEKGTMIRVDGRAEEPAWSTAQKIPLQDPFGTGEKREAYTGRMLWDEEGVYFSFEMDGKPQGDPSRGMFRNDNVEVFLSPGMEINEYFQFVVNAADAVWTGQRTLKPVATPYNANWECAGFRHAVDVRDNGWSFEMFVPFEAIGREAPEPGELWYMNIVGNKLGEPSEYSAFSLTQGNNHNVELYGYLRFH